MSILSALVVGPISKRNLVRGPLLACAGSALVASVGVLFLTAGTSVSWILLITLIFGVAMGTLASGSQTALYLLSTSEQMGTAAGLLRTFGSIGSIASSALIGIAFHTEVSDSGLHRMAMMMIAVSVIALLMPLGDRRLATSNHAGVR